MNVKKIKFGQLVRGMMDSGKRPDAYEIYFDKNSIKNIKPQDITDWIYNMVIPSLSEPKQVRKEMCKNCQWWNPYQGFTGQCRAAAPIITLHPLSEGSTHLNQQRHYPFTDENEGCGQFKEGKYNE